jgi:hypothetical protein
MRFMSIPSLASLALAFLVAIAIAFIGILVSRRNDFLIKF